MEVLKEKYKVLMRRIEEINEDGPVITGVMGLNAYLDLLFNPKNRLPVLVDKYVQRAVDAADYLIKDLVSNGYVGEAEEWREFIDELVDTFRDEMKKRGVMKRR